MKNIIKIGIISSVVALSSMGTAHAWWGGGPGGGNFGPFSNNGSGMSDFGFSMRGNGRGNGNGYGNGRGNGYGNPYQGGYGAPYGYGGPAGYGAPYGNGAYPPPPPQGYGMPGAYPPPPGYRN